MIYGEINGKKVLFIHIPKCAGTAIVGWGKTHITKQNSGLIDTVNATIKRNKAWENHTHATWLMNKAIVKDSIFNYEPIFVMRDPFEWQQSWFTHILNHNQKNRATFVDIFDKTFTEYIEFIRDLKDGTTTAQVKHVYHTTLHQSDWFFDGTDYMLDNVIDFDGIRKNFDAHLLDRFGFENPSPLKNPNATTYNKDADYTDETREIISRLFKRDIEIYNEIKGRND